MHFQFQDLKATKVVSSEPVDRGVEAMDYSAYSAEAILWPGFHSSCWHHGEERYLIVLNLSGYSSQGFVRVPFHELAGHSWRLTGALSGEDFEREGSRMLSPWMYVDLSPWRFHFLKLSGKGI